MYVQHQAQRDPDFGPDQSHFTDSWAEAQECHRVSLIGDQQVVPGSTLTSMGCALVYVYKCSPAISEVALHLPLCRLHSDLGFQG